MIKARCGFAWTTPAGEHRCRRKAGHWRRHESDINPHAFVAVGAEGFAANAGWKPRWEHTKETP